MSVLSLALALSASTAAAPPPAGGASSTVFPGAFLVGDATWARVPSWLVGVPATFYQSLPHGAGHTLECTGFDACDAYVFQYRCAGCPFDDGGLPIALGSLGFTSFACAPTFRWIPGGSAHRMLGWRLRLDRGQSVAVDSGAEMAMVAFAVIEAIDCDSRGDRQACEGASELCAWGSGVCEYRQCGKPTAGPQLPDTCSNHCLAADLP
ncbi:hypothetical protein DIPPA_07412 [Diplonema papillatum]|nr:hypothetical protein DIPPA_07412 [Diplonema papillatum]